MAFPESVKIVEVGPRDGLQNEKAVSLEQKIALVNTLSKTGLGFIETGSFVSPRWVPQMADSAALFAGIERVDGVTYSALIPNLKGLEAAINAGVDEIAVFGSPSEGFSQKNINCSIAESLTRFEPVVARAREVGLKVRGYVSCALGCPYDGNIEPKKVAAVARSLDQLGCYEISLGDTIGVGTAVSTEAMICEVAQVVPINKLAVHFHDTYGQALVNIYKALELGVAVVDSAVAGLGGCPYASGAAGNVATEELVYLLDSLGIKNGVSLETLVHASWQICETLGRKPGSKVSLAIGKTSCSDPEPS